MPPARSTGLTRSCPANAHLDVVAETRNVVAGEYAHSWHRTKTRVVVKVLVAEHKLAP
jgi:hypothetical protein